MQQEDYGMELTKVNLCGRKIKILIIKMQFFSEPYGLCYFSMATKNSERSTYLNCCTGITSLFGYPVALHPQFIITLTGQHYTFAHLNICTPQFVKIKTTFYYCVNTMTTNKI